MTPIPTKLEPMTPKEWLEQQSKTLARCYLYRLLDLDTVFHAIAEIHDLEKARAK